MNFVLEPQPNEGNGDANNHTSEALNKTLDHAMLVRTFITHRTHQKRRALQSTGIAFGCFTLSYPKKSEACPP